MSLELRKKYSFRVGGQRVVLLKKSYESSFHVLAKALVYALYSKRYPSLAIEKVIQNRYKPDLVALAPDRQIVFWAECGAVKPEKIAKLLHKFRNTHFVFVKKSSHIHAFMQILEKIMKKLKHSVNVEIIAFPPHFEQFIDEKGNIAICAKDCKIHDVGSDNLPVK